MEPLEPFSVTITGRLRHGALWSVLREHGAIHRVAREIGISERLLGRWLNLQSVPNLSIRWHREAVNHLEAITGRTADQLWPEFTRSKEWLHVTKTIDVTRDISPAQLSNVHQYKALPAPDAEALSQELADRIHDVLETLPSRQRQIIQLRFGLDGYPAHTLDEVAKYFGLTQERIRQIEIKAMRKLQQPNRAGELITWTEPDR